MANQQLFEKPSNSQVLLPETFVPRPDFERGRYDVPKPIEYTGRIATATVKSKLFLPDTITDPYPCVLIHGYMGPEIAYTGLAKAIATTGKPVVTYQPPRRQEIRASLSSKHLLHPERLLAQAALVSMYGAIDRLKDMGHQHTQFDLTGHSMGGRQAVKIAQLKPHMTRSVVLNQAAGLDGHTLFDFITNRIPNFVQKELRPALLNNRISTNEFLAISKELSYYTFRNPYKTIAEGIAAGSCNIRQDLQDITNNGTKTAIIVGQSDTMISATGTAYESGNTPNIFSVYSSPKANHLAPFTHPKETATSLLQVLEQLHKEDIAI